MRPTSFLARRGFWGRSVDEFKRMSEIALRLEGVKGASRPYELRSFRDAESINECKTMSDADMGGFSTAHLDWVAASQPSSSPTSTSASASASSPASASASVLLSPEGGRGGYARFHGTISTELPKDRPEIQRTGYAAWRTLDRGATIFGRSLINIDPYVFLALRIKSDGRSYFINVQTESVIPSDLHQHRLFAKRPGEWETVLVKWNDFVRTNHGYVVEPQTELLREKVRSIGLGLTDRVPGPFELCIERIWATNDIGEADHHHHHGPASVVQDEGELKNKQGQRIKWGET